MRLFIRLLCCFIPFLSWSQTENIDIEITTSGVALNKEISKQIALRSALEQAFGTFISSKTEILNDSILTDQMSSISSGNIKSFEIINENKLPDENWITTLKVIVSLDKLVAFVQSQGHEVSINGGLFAINIKQHQINELNEINVFYDLIGLLHETMQKAFDYEIVASEPKTIENDNNNWGINLKVIVKANSNIITVNDLLLNTMKSISLTNFQCNDYNKLGKTIYRYRFNGQDFFFRKSATIDLLNSFFGSFDFYRRCFEVESEIHTIQGLLKGEYSYSDFIWKSSNIVSLNPDDSLYRPTVNLRSGTYVATYETLDELQLRDIERLTKYKVTSTGIISRFSNGGLLISDPRPSKYMIGIGVDKHNRVNRLPSAYPAYQNGVDIGDKIINVNNFQFIDIKQIQDAINTGEKVTIEFEREGSLITKIISPILDPERKGLVLALCNISDKEFDFNNSLISGNEIMLGGYNEWRIPSEDERRIVFGMTLNFGLAFCSKQNFWIRNFK